MQGEQDLDMSKQAFNLRDDIPQMKGPAHEKEQYKKQQSFVQTHKKNIFRKFI